MFSETLNHGHETAKAVADTLHKAVDTTAHASGGSSSDWIMHHIQDGSTLDFTPFGQIHLPVIKGTLHLPLINELHYDISITRHVVFMWIAAIILLAVMLTVAARYKKTLLPKGLVNFIEVFILFVRDEIARPSIGRGYEYFMPYLLTVFFFILFGNFIGLIPFAATMTSNIAVTSVLATLTFFAIQIGGIRKNGFFGYFKGLLPHGIPVLLLPVIAVVEFIGLFTKPFALAIRLFANMTAGHIVIFALIGLIFVLKTLVIAPVAVGMALFIYLLEVLIALLQAYIFTMLSAVFIGMAVHQEH